MAKLQTKRTTDPPAPTDGTRVLVMRLWPRRFRNERADLWLKDLGCSVDLIKRWKAGKLAWGAFRQEYLGSLEGPEAARALGQLRALLKQGRVTLLCSCPDERRCHRGILAEVLRGRRRSGRPPAA
jgi:uncharacterized protein YeaO (DUF488 family)